MLDATDQLPLRADLSRILFLEANGRVSHAVLNTSRGVRSRIFIRYGTVRLASNFAVSRSNHPKPFRTMSSWSGSRKSDNLTISRKFFFARVPRMSATQAARRCHRFDDFAQRKTNLLRAGLARIIGEIRSCTSAS